MQTQPLQNQRAIVTGANSGIGEACVRALAGAGAAVCINWVSHPEATQKIVDDLRADGHTASDYRADVSDEAQVEAMFAHVIQNGARWTSSSTTPGCRTTPPSST